MIKALGKNHNDKNQVYSGAGFGPIHPVFELQFAQRVESKSKKKRGAHEGQPILEGRFADFRWVGENGDEVPVKNLKLIIYPQYPEARLSGFDPVVGNMPPSMSVQFTKDCPQTPRYLVLARRGSGAALGLMIVNPSAAFTDAVVTLPSTKGSRVWKRLDLGLDHAAELKGLLSSIVAEEHVGCRLTRDGEIIPFNGTQVCGFTLEQALGIRPNSRKDGDFYGIELKTHTQKKVTLFTPEPDLGDYNNDFRGFMTRYGYEDKSKNYRFTGIHRCGVRCDKSGLTLRIDQYDPSRTLASQADRMIVIGLYDDQGKLAAGWSLSRILNCWGAKHNEAVYVPAKKFALRNNSHVAAGYKFGVKFEADIVWCKHTSADRLLRAIDSGTIFLDPAPKYDPVDAVNSKRRSQWRVNDIRTAVNSLYEQVDLLTLN